MLNITKPEQMTTTTMMLSSSRRSHTNSTQKQCKLIIQSRSQITLNNLVLEKNTDGAWEASEWEATGQGNFGSGSMEFDGSITVGYTKDNEDTAENEGEEQSNNEEGRYYINEATLSAEAEDIFAGNITEKNIIITKDNGKWGAESWSASANLTLPGLPIKNSAEAAIDTKGIRIKRLHSIKCRSRHRHCRGQSRWCGSHAVC